MKKIREEQIEKQSNDLKNIMKFLSLINSTINDIRKSAQKKYSLLSSILNCFYKKKTISLPIETIYKYIHLDILNYKNKMVISFCKNGTNKMDIISEKNYQKKIHCLYMNNKCFIRNISKGKIDKISLNINFIIAHKNFILINIFGKDAKLSIIELKKINYIKEDTDFSNAESKIININNINNKSDSSSKVEEIQYLNKKKKSHRENAPKGLKKIKKNNSTNFSEEKNESYTRELLVKEDEDDKQVKSEKKESILEKEISSLIKEDSQNFSLPSYNDVLKEKESKKNNSINSEDNDEIFFKNLLLKYQNGETLKSYVNMINNDNEEFQNSIKSLIEYKNSLKDNSSGDNAMIKFSIMNKIIFGKEKCNILIDKIIANLKQLILEYKFIEKVLNNIDENKSDIFQIFKETVTNISNKQEKENYVSDLKKK